MHLGEVGIDVSIVGATGQRGVHPAPGQAHGALS